MHRRLIALPVSVIVASGLAACGSEALSQDEYVKQADAICKDFKAKGNKLPEPKSLADFAALADRAKPLLEDEIGELRDLEAPDEIKDQTSQAYDLLEKQADALDDLKAAAEKNDTAKAEKIATDSGKLAVEAQQKAPRVGFKVCGSGA